MSDLAVTPEAVDTSTDRSSTATAGDIERHLEQYRGELTGYCYRMTGSAFEAEDAVQETMLRAWRAYERFEGRSSVRSWLYRIATNVCLDSLNGRERRARPMDLQEAGAPVVSALGQKLPEVTWVEPMPDSRVLDADDPAERAVQRDSVRLALITALQRLAPRQRAVLILREVLAWKASEVAELLDTTVASVNSALQRARATLASSEAAELDPSDPMDSEQQALLARYVEVFESYDLDAFTALLHEDATLSMPPYPLWLRGPADIRAWMEGPGCDCRGSRLVPAGTANGAPAFGQYRPSGPNGEHEPWALQVIEISGGKVVGFNAFLDTAKWFPMFGLPASPPN